MVNQTNHHIISRKIRTSTETIKELNQILCNLHIFSQVLKNFHWNIKGPQFFVLHPLFEEWYEATQAEIDEVAERILMLGVHPKSTLLEYVKKATIHEPSGIVTSEIQMMKKIQEDVQVLIENHKATITAATEYKDEGTIDLIVGHLGVFEKRAWKIKAWMNN